MFCILSQSGSRRSGPASSQIGGSEEDGWTGSDPPRHVTTKGAPDAQTFNFGSRLGYVLEPPPLQRGALSEPAMTKPFVHSRKSAFRKGIGPALSRSARSLARDLLFGLSVPTMVSFRIGASSEDPMVLVPSICLPFALLVVSSIGTRANMRYKGNLNTSR